MKKILFALILLSAALACAQSTLKTTASLTAACTNATTTCDGTASSQLKLSVGEYSMASITFHGTFTGVTVFFEFSDDGGTTWYPSTCTRNDAALQENSEALADSTNRSFDCGTAAAGIFRIRQNAISTGTLLVGASQSAIQVEPAPTVSVAGQDAKGVLVHGTTGGITCTVAVSTATTIQAVGGSCATPGAGLSIYITDVSFGSSAASGTAADSFPTLKSGTGGTCGSGTAVIWQALSAANTTQEYHPHTPIKVAANSEVCWIMTTAGSKTVQITGFIAP